MTVILAQRENPLIEISAILTQCDRPLDEATKRSRSVPSTCMDYVHEGGGEKKFAPTATKKERGEEAAIHRTVRGLPQR